MPLGIASVLFLFHFFGLDNLYLCCNFMPHLSRVMGEDKKMESKCGGGNLGWELMMK